MSGGLLGALGLLTWSVPALSQEAAQPPVPEPGRSRSPLAFIRYTSGEGEPIQAKSGGRIELELDGVVNVRWQQREYFEALCQDLQIPAPSGPELGQRIDGLGTAADALVTCDRSFAQMMRLERAYAGQRGAHAAELRSANDAYSQATVQALEPLVSLLATQPSDPPDYVERCKALEKALEDFALAERSIADGEATYDGYLQMAGAVRSFVADEARVLTDELARRLQSGQKIQVSMEAMLIESLGRSTPVHLDGYDRIQVGDPRPFQRIRLAVDERTQKELAAAEKLGSTLQKLKSGEYQRELRATLERLRTSLASLREGLRAVELEKHLSALLVDLRALADDDLAPLLARVRDLRDRVLLLARVPELPGDSGAAQLAALSRILDGIARDLTKELETLPATLRTLADEVENVFRQHGREARAEILTFLRDAQARLEQDLSGLKALYDELKELARAFGLLEDTATDLERVERIPRDVTPGSALDTFFDLETIRDREPRPGDALALIVRVVRTLGEREETVGYGRQSFRLVSYRWYLEPNGALFFIDPRDSIPRDLDFEPSVGLGLHWKIDLRGFGLWNDILRPGFGVSFTLLDFDDDKGFELGVAGSLTLFRDILWVGYGRDLQAEADYFYLGVNPLVLGGLWRQ